MDPAIYPYPAEVGHLSGTSRSGRNLPQWSPFRRSMDRKPHCGAKSYGTQTGLVLSSNKLGSVGVLGPLKKGFPSCTTIPLQAISHIYTLGTMTSHKRPATVSLEENFFDDPIDDTDTSEWEAITQDPVKRVAFERKCIEDELTKENRVILLQDNPSTRSHCRFWDCIPTKLNGEPNIRSAFRFNVKDLSGRYYGES